MRRAGGALATLGLGPCTLLADRIDHGSIGRDLGALPAAAWGRAGRNPAVQMATEAFFAYGSRRGPGGRIHGEREVLRALPALRDLVYSLPCEKIDRVLVARLPPGGFVPLHVDTFKYYAHSVRLVFVIATDPRARLYVDGAWWHFREGEVWAFDNLYQHAAVNDGTLPRTHVLVDLTPNDALQARVSAGGSVPGERDDARTIRLEIDSRRRYAERRWHLLGYRALEALRLR
jgi:hypothetical protein